MDESLSLFEIYDEKFNEIMDEFQLVYESDMMSFSNRLNLYQEGVCTINDAFNYFTEASGSTNVFKKMTKSILEFIDKIQENLSKIFSKNNLKESMNSLSKEKDKTSKNIESTIDYEAYVKFDRDMNDRVQKVVKGVKPSNIEAKTEELQKLAEEYESEKMKNRFMKTGLMISIASLLSVGAYFLVKGVSKSRYESVTEYVKKENDSDSKEPMEQKDRMNFLSALSRFIHAREKSVTATSVKLSNDINTESKKRRGKISRMIHRKSETYAGIARAVKNTASTIIQDEDRKAYYKKERDEQAARQKRHDEGVKRELKNIDRAWKKIPRPESD